MKQSKVKVYNKNTGEIIDTFICEFPSVNEIRYFIDIKLHNYNESYLNLHYYFS